MDSSDFDELIEQAKQIGKMLGDLFEEVTGEELDLEGAIKHYPLIAVGLGLGVGAFAGWWVGSKRRPALPPPQQTPSQEAKTASGFGRLGELLKGIQNSSTGEGEGTNHPRDVLENLFPSGVEKVRDVLPDVVSEEAAAMAKTWVDTVLEPKLRQGIDTMTTNVSESKLGIFFRQTLARYEETEDHHLDDPDTPPAP
jgi:hypothetical protein